MSGSLFPTDQTGLMWTVLGFMLVVLFAVTATVFVDANMTKSQWIGGDGETAEQEAAEEIERLERALKRLQQEEEERISREGLSEEHQELLKTVAGRMLEVEELELEIDLRRESLERRNEEIRQFQVSYRESIWKRAEGRELGELVCVDSRTYQDAKITGVSVEGVGISHASGAVRVETRFVPKSLRDELLLDLGESQARAKRLMDERLARWEEARKEVEEQPIWEVSVRRPVTQGGSVARQQRQDERKAQRLVLQEQLNGWHIRLVQLNEEIAALGSINLHGGAVRKRNVPGSLETLEERRLRLNKLKARVELRIRQLKNEIDLLYY